MNKVNVETNPVERLVINGWSKEFPTKAGLYWFYSYRYGKTSCGRKQEPELMLAKVIEISNGTLVTADGQFVSESEVEEARFKPAELPELPEI